MTFSIVIPSFQQGRYLERAIRSVVLQQEWPVELFVLDGGSTDESVEVIQKFRDKISFWRSEKDEGQTAAINEGLSRASGTVFAYLNSDDYYLPGALAKAQQAFAGSSASWIAGDAWYIREGKEGRYRLHAKPPPGDPVLLWGHPWCPPQPSTFWKVDVFKKVGPFCADLQYNMDTEMAVRLAFAGLSPALLNDPLSVRWDHAGAKSAHRDRFFREWLEVVRRGPLQGRRKEIALRLVENRIRWGRDVAPWGKWCQRLADVAVYPKCLAGYFSIRRSSLPETPTHRADVFRSGGEGTGVGHQAAAGKFPPAGS